jgi:hypothetical protein
MRSALKPETDSVALHELAPGVRWSVEADGLLVMDGQHRVHRLGYPEAAIWDLVSRGYSPDRCAQMMVYIVGESLDGARALVDRALNQWTEIGLFIKASPNKASQNGKRLRHLPVQP